MTSNDQASSDQPNNEWDAYAAGWDGDPGARAYAAAAIASLEEAAGQAGQAVDGARVLDFGCGTGLLTERLVGAGAVVDAVDTSPAMLAVLQSKVDANSWLHVTLGTELPQPPERYDLIVCSSVCGFLPDYTGTVADLAGRLTDAGLFVQWDWERTDPDSHGLTRSEIEAALQRAGLRDVEVRVGFRQEFEGEVMAPLMGTGRR